MFICFQKQAQRMKLETEIVTDFAQLETVKHHTHLPEENSECV